MICRTLSDLPDLSHAKTIIIDTETSGLRPHQGSRMCGVVIGTDDSEQGWYVPIRHIGDKNLPLENVLRWLKATLSPNRNYCFHNAQFDLGILRADGIEVSGRILDTMVLAHVFDSSFVSYEMDFLTRWYLPDFEHKEYEKLKIYLNQTQPTKETVFGKLGRNYALVPVEILGPYALEDLRATRELLKVLRKQKFAPPPKNEDRPAWGTRELIQNECELTRTLFEMQDAGVLFDHERCAQLKEKALDEIEQIQAQMARLAGFSFSPSQYSKLTKALEVCGSPPIFWMKPENVRGKQKAQQYTEHKDQSTGRPCFNSSAVLESMKRFKAEGKHAAFELMRLFHESETRQKICSTYFDNYLDMQDYAHVIHGSFLQHGTVTGRLSSRTPNCFSADTEVLTLKGWKLFSEITAQDKLAQFDTAKSTIDFTTPDRLIVKQYAGKMIKLYSEQQIDLLLTPDHACLLQHRKSKKMYKVDAEDYSKDAQQINAGMYVGNNKNYSYEQLTLIAAFQADGSVVQNGGCKFSFTKTRKIKRLKIALRVLKITHKQRKNKAGVTTFYIGRKEFYRLTWLVDKKFFAPWILELTQKAFQFLAEEIWKWDGVPSRRSMYCSKHKNNADWAQILTVLSGRRARVRSYTNNNNKDYWIVDASNRAHTQTSRVIKTDVAYKGHVYCVTMPKGTVVVRRNGRVAITGQCQNLAKPDGTSDQKTFEEFLGEKNELALNRQVRSLFIARPGHRLVSIDFSQVEYRVAVFLSQDEHMMKLWRDNPNVDYHTATSELIGVDRSRCKTINFLSLYGGGPAALAATLTSMGKPTTVSDAKQILNKLFDARPSLRQLINQLTEEAQRNGNVQNVFGRVVRVPTGLEYVALNYKDQGTAGDFMRERMVAISKYIREKALPVKLLMTVHDELVFEMPTELVAEITPQLMAQMTICPMMNVPFTADAEVGVRWSDQIPFKEWVTYGEAKR